MNTRYGLDDLLTRVCKEYNLSYEWVSNGYCDAIKLSSNSSHSVIAVEWFNFDTKSSNELSRLTAEIKRKAAELSAGDLE